MATVSDVESAHLASGTVPRTRVAGQVLMLALLAGLVGVGAHLAGGGAIPTTCMAWVSVAAVAAPTTLLARALATRHRTSWRAFVALGSEQLGIELVLQANDRSVEGPLTTLAVHLVANVVLGVMLVGTARARADLSAAMDRVLPRLGGPPHLPARVPHPLVIGRVPLLAPYAISPRSLRGPPRSVVLH